MVTVRGKKRTETKKPNREPAVDVTKKEQGSKISWRTDSFFEHYVYVQNKQGGPVSEVHETIHSLTSQQVLSRTDFSNSTLLCLS